ncbi:TPA: L-tyrosine/L-tryptophan isonitrile synthase family protein [Legionella feeleii]
MKKKVLPQSERGLYKSGLDREREAVISAHFMHKINQESTSQLYNAKTFSQKAMVWDFKTIQQQLIPAILGASEQFIKERAAAIKARAKKNYKEYGLKNENEIGLVEMIAEIMVDRQFLKGSKSNYPRLNLAKKINDLLEKQKPLRMVIPALPYKTSSPLKSRGTMPDFAEVNFLLALAEVVKTIKWICKEYYPNELVQIKGFTIVSDGSRFNHFLNEPSHNLSIYQEQLNNWLEILQITEDVEISDYQKLITLSLPTQLYANKTSIREQVRQLYLQLMLPLLDFYDMDRTIHKAIDMDPEPESSNLEGRFVPLFKSLIYIVNYKCLSHYADLYGESYSHLYSKLSKHIFVPYTVLTSDVKTKIEQSISCVSQVNDFSNESLMEYLRQSMLEEAWMAAINYIAEIRSDRDLKEDPISTCLPDYIRWTIHAKPGQLAILTTTAFGDPVQPWHGAGVFKRTKNNKIKLYTLPVLALEGMGAIPVIIENEPNYLKQPLFYIDPEIAFENAEDFINLIKNQLTRKRKF